MSRFTPAEAASAPVGIVVDVLRATSTIAQALASGYERVLCCREIDEARELRARIPDALVGGERDAVRIEGFDVGASPREFLERRPRDEHADPLDDERDERHPRGGRAL
jgi:2-phosphosulfolactate phosphatase